MSNLSEAYRILNNILNKGSYSNVEMKNLSKDCDRAFVTRTIYGVIDNNIKLDYYIEKLTDKRPKPNISLIIKIGLYLLTGMSMPEYACINSTVELSKELGKQGVAGFINAVLRNWSKVELPLGNSVYSLSIRYSYPEWVVKKLIAQFGLPFAEEYLKFQFVTFTHIRHNERALSKADFDALIAKIDIHKDAKSTIYGYYVSHNILDILREKYSEMYTPQSLGSMLVCNAVSKKDGIKIIDVCAAPGGKSIYLSELMDAEVTACDIYPHRVDLIKNYAKRMRADIKTVCADAVVFEESYKGVFDAVMCDVPCSGFGVVNSKPDIKLNKKINDLLSLPQLQYDILVNSSRYVKKGGELIYSTCTIFKEENEDVVKRFLNNTEEFRLEKISLPVMPKRDTGIPECIQFLPNLDLVSGYFMAKFVRV